MASSPPEGGAAATTVAVDDLASLAGKHLGRSGWHEITQERVNLFADATGDHQWIHVDPGRAADGPFGTTIAHGYLTLSLVPSSSPAAARNASRFSNVRGMDTPEC